MPIVKLRENEPFETAIRRFKRSCEKAGIISEMRRHEYFEKPTWEKKRKTAQAVKRLQKKLSREKMEPIRGARSKSKSRSKSRLKGGKK